MSYLSPAQNYADNKEKYSSLKSAMNAVDSNTDYENFIKRNSYLQNKQNMNNKRIRNNYDDYHFDNVTYSQAKNSMPSPSFSQYQSPTQNANKYNSIHHNRSNPYEYTMNSEDYSFEEYLRDSKIKRSRSDSKSEYTMNSNPSMAYANYCPPEYNHKKSLNNHSHNHDHNQSSNSDYEYGYYQGPYNNYKIDMSSYSNYMCANRFNEEAYDNMVKQKFGYDFSKIRSASADMSGLYRNMLDVIQQDPLNKDMIPDRYGMKSDDSMKIDESLSKSNNNNTHEDDDCQKHNESQCSAFNEKDLDNNESFCTVCGSNYTEKYSAERADELFVFYISFLCKELVKNTKKMGSSGQDTQSSITGPIQESGPVVANAGRSNGKYNNSSMNNGSSHPSRNGDSNNSNNNNNSSQGSYMSQSDPYYSPPCSPYDRDDHNTDVKYCIHLILNKGKIESYINLPKECILCHHTCHMETVVETVAEIYSNRFCSNSLNHCNFCKEHECKKKCVEFNKTRLANEDINIDLETVESFMNKYSPPRGEDAHNTSMSSDDSDVQTLNGNTSTMSTLSSPKRGDFPHRSRSIHSSKIQDISNSSFSDKRSESSATLMDQSTSFDNDLSRQSSRKSTLYDGDLSRQSSRKSTKSTIDLHHQRSMNESFLKNYNLYGNEANNSSHALKTPGESIIDDNASRSRVEISKSDSRNNFDPTGHESSLVYEYKHANTSSASSTGFYQEAVANTSTTAKNMAKAIEENTSFENRKGYEKYDRHNEYKGDPKTLKRLRDAEENRRKVKEKIGYERKVLSFLEAHGGEVTDPEDIRELTEIFGKEFSFYGFILRFSMVFAIICAMFSEHSRHISYNVDSFINISKIVVFVIVKNITPITSCISALILYVRFIETMDYETAGDRYKMVRHFSELVRDEEFGHCVDKILGEYIEKINGTSTSKANNTNISSTISPISPSSSTSSNAMEEDGKELGSYQSMDDIAHMQFRSKRQINSDLPIFPSSSMNERNRNVVIDSYLLFIICLIISHKYTIDTCEYNYKNKSWYFIYTFFLKDYKNPNITMKQFNQYEFYILCVLQYNIHISMEEYNNFDIFVKRNCSSFGKDLSLYITTNVLEKLSKAMVHQEYYKKLNSNNYKNYIFNSVINNMENKIRVFFEQVVTMVKRNTNEYNRKYNNNNNIQA